MSRPSAPARYAGGVVVVDVVRNGFVESRHHGSIAVVDADGALVSSAGDPIGPVFPRSANKPMQAIALLQSGLRLSDPADVALVAASHRGERFHIDRVRALLGSRGLTEDDLRCPPDLPIGDEARAEVLRAGGGPRPIYMNCSGKHAGMLLTCQTAGWPRDDYRTADHPVQKACRAAVEEFSGETVAAVGVDGCGAAVMAISLTGLARAFVRLVEAPQGSDARRVADAMRAHPDLVAGTGATDTLLMRSLPGLLVKGGAEGVLAAAIPGVGAVAVKIDDGAMRGTVAALAAGLAALGVSDPAVDELAAVPVLGGGVPVGRLRPSTTPPGLTRIRAA